MVAGVLSRVSATALALLALAAPASAAAPERVPGKLAFTTEAGTFHATRAITRTLFATDDPDGRRLAVWSEPDGRGVTALHVKVVGSGGDPVTSTEIGFRARPGERYLGFGERSNAVDQRGGEVESYVAEGPYEEDDRAVIPAFVPPWGYHPRPDATYFPIPWLLSTAGYGVLVDNPETSFYRLDQDGSGTWSVAVEAARLDLRVFAGPRPADVLRRFIERVGPPARGGRAVLLRPLVPAAGRRAGRSWRRAARARRAALGRADLHALPAVRVAGRPRGRRAGARRGLPRRRGSRSPPTSTR